MSWNNRTRIKPGDQAILKLPSGLLKPIEIKPNTIISIGKFGSFHTNSLIGRPFWRTYDILDLKDGEKHARLRVVPASDLNSETLSVDNTPQDDAPVKEDAEAAASANEKFDIVGEDGSIIMRNNRLTVDDTSRQALTMTEIEELKNAGTGSGKEVIAKIMAAHSALGEKTEFSLAKYTLRKSKKFLKRFTVLPMEVGTVAEYIMDKDSSRIMELRPESLGLVASWSNAHHAGNLDQVEGNPTQGRYMVVDDTGGLLVATLAERMGILYPPASEKEPTEQPDPDTNQDDDAMPDQVESTTDAHSGPSRPNPKDTYQAATSNTITVIHPHTQPNLSLLRYFGYILEDTSSSSHPLYSHLHNITWLQLLDPSADTVYSNPPPAVDADTLASWKPSKRGQHFRKLRRHTRTQRVADTTRAGGFDSLVVASFMQPASVLRHLVPLVKGGGQIVVYSPSIEPLTELMDYYSRERRGAYMKMMQERVATGLDVETCMDDEEEDFPVNPTLLLNPMLQTSRVVEWQVLPGRTHPLMTSRGGPEGYVFSATRVLPAIGKVNAKGNFSKKRKAEETVSESPKKLRVEHVEQTKETAATVVGADA
ncbi:adenine-N(1)--methyltransferase non-catalytic subunit trm6 [Microthyrium microscopicum]|uniref:tRNA (adenine(58)-N(1))-methyltransferase non-catalytic subunit TRM6 n=1 Tax=Microthyrium microscopicum TaxID=703497 RepID=A0A6A6U368_9PEZI|nr:adenine-N(1)--methyltransferase non-catalytic subunit trm6 [Microthyrium microscopicum]